VKTVGNVREEGVWTKVIIIQSKRISGRVKMEVKPHKKGGKINVLLGNVE